MKTSSSQKKNKEFLELYSFTLTRDNLTGSNKIMIA